MAAGPVDGRSLNRLSRRQLIGRAQPAADLVITRVNDQVHVGIVAGGSVRLSDHEAINAARALLAVAETADAEGARALYRYLAGLGDDQAPNDSMH